MPVRDALLASYLISQWIFLSSSIILYNKYILSSAGFPFPVCAVAICLPPHCSEQARALL